jgi:hypothetical protein
LTLRTEKAVYSDKTFIAPNNHRALFSCRFDLPLENEKLCLQVFSDRKTVQSFFEHIVGRIRCVYLDALLSSQITDP